LIGAPPARLARLLLDYRFIGMAGALGNLIGNCIATVVVAGREGDLDRDRARHVLDGEELVDVTAG
jgi:aerobic C4-dicarboxylate transport protein